MLELRWLSTLRLSGRLRLGRVPISVTNAYAFAISFKSAIVTTPGLKFAGKLPDPFDNEEPFTAVVLKSAGSPDLARAFVASLIARTRERSGMS